MHLKNSCKIKVMVNAKLMGFFHIHVGDGKGMKWLVLEDSFLKWTR